VTTGITIGDGKRAIGLDSQESTEGQKDRGKRMVAYTAQVLNCIGRVCPLLPAITRCYPQLAAVGGGWP
jgi:hypothetical protein